MNKQFSMLHYDGNYCITDPWEAQALSVYIDEDTKQAQLFTSMKYTRNNYIIALLI